MSGKLYICCGLLTLLISFSSVRSQPEPHPGHHDQREPTEQDPSRRGRPGSNASDKYLVVLPNVLTSGSSEVICITVFDMEGPMEIQIRLTVGEEVTDLEYFMEFPYACLELTIPEIDTPSQEATLVVSGGQVSSRWAGRQQIKIEKPKLETFVETDKPIYKPGQTIKFRVLTLDQNLRTVTRPVDKIWVETPSGVRVAQWLAVEGEQGLISLELPMTSDPMMGTWKIKVLRNDERVESTFEVDEYVLPKFEVTVEGPAFVLINETTVRYKICGRYTYGQPVQGSVTASLTPELQYQRTQMSTIRFTARNTRQDGCVNALFDIREWSLNENYYSLHEAKLKLSTNFTETVTGVSITKADNTCKLTREIYKLEFVGDKKFRKGLPFTAKVKVTSPDGTPVPGVIVEVTRTSSREDQWEATTDSRGLAVFEELDSAGYTYAYFQAAVSERTLPAIPHPPREYVIQAGTAQASYRSYFSPNENFLQMSPLTGELAVGSQAIVDISYAGTQKLQARDFTAIFMAKGNIVRPEKRFSISRRISEEGRESYFRNQLTFRVTREMMPITKLLVYFVYQDEVVADSIVFNVQKALDNQVEISFTSDEERPGEKTWMDISAAPESICGVGVVDKSVYLLGGGQNNIQESQIWKYLQSTQLGAGSGVSSNRCEHGGRQPWDLRMPGTGQPEDADASAAFKDAGLQYLTNLVLESAPCPPRYEIAFSMGGNFRGGPRGPFPMAMDMDTGTGRGDSAAGEAEETAGPKAPEPPRIRSYFPETWLWDLVPVDSDGHGYVNMTVPDTITEWVGSGFCISEAEGIGISDSSRLQAFQPFFVSYTLPYSVIRGETFPVKVTVFNYMSDCLVVELTLSESENFTIEEGESRVKSICVCGSQSASVEFNIIPDMLGMMPIKVDALSISDFDGLCGNEIVPVLRNAGDAIQKEILVEAEGIEQEVTKSQFFCTGEQDPDFAWSTLVEAPANIVPDTAWAKVTFTGDVMGTTLSNLDKLVQVPYGCGEQNMLTFVPNVLAMHYLTVTDQLTPEVEQAATDNMKLGYQREFNYRHGDGSFSAFGESDPSGSTWLTAYVVRSFSRASEFIDVDSEELEKSIDWLKGLQMENGCFRTVGKLCHKDMLGGVNNDLTQSAYVVTSLLEAGKTMEEEAVARGVQCLESQVLSSDDTYALAQVAYALALAESTRLDAVLDRLEDLAVFDDGKHWVSSRDAPTSGGHHVTSSADVEITSYVLMTYMAAYEMSEVIAKGLEVTKWLVQQRNGNGGFGSTQDTVVGMTALSRYAEYTTSGDMDLMIAVESSVDQSDWGARQELRVTDADRLVLRQFYMDVIPSWVDFEASGQGCALTQVSLYYNVYPEEPELPQFDLAIIIDDHPQYIGCTHFLVRVCTNYLGDDGASNMAVVDFRLQSGYAPDEGSLKALQASTPELKRYEMDGKSVLFYFDEVTIKPICVEFVMKQEVKVKDTKPSFATVYDYYKTEIKKTVEYSLQCSTKPALGVTPEARTWGRVAALGIFSLPAPAETSCEKVGHCDFIPEDFVCEEPQVDQCTDDSACPGERKCCNNGCASTCAYPQFPVPQPDWDIELESPVNCFSGASCPICEDELPEDFHNKFCHSYYVVDGRVKRNTNKIKISENYRFRADDNVDVVVDYILDESCECEFEQGRKYMLFLDYSNLDLESRTLNLNATALLVPFRSRIPKTFDRPACPID